MSLRTDEILPLKPNNYYYYNLQFMVLVVFTLTLFFVRVISHKWLSSYSNGYSITKTLNSTFNLIFKVANMANDHWKVQQILDAKMGAVVV